MKLINNSKLCQKQAQSVVEYCVMFSVVAAILIVAINGPMRNSLNAAIRESIDTVNQSIRGIIE